MKRSKRIAALVLSLIMSLSILTGCGGKQEEKTPAANTPAAEGTVAAKPGEGEVYCFIANAHGIEFFNAAKAGVYAASSELGATWFVGGASESGAPSSEISDAIEQAIAMGATGIILHGQYDDTADAITTAMEAGVPVINIDTDIGTDRLSFIGTSPEQLGVYMAHDAAEVLGGKGEVIISGDTTQPSNNRTVDKIKEIFATEYPDIKIVSELHDKCQSQQAAAVVGAALQANPNAALVIGTQAPTGVGAAAAIREAGLEDQVKVICRDRDQATLDAIKNGEIESTWVQTSFIQAYTATMWLHQYVNDKLALVPGYRELGLNPLPAFAEASMVRVDASNVDDFLGATYTFEVTAKN
ncbi:MAG: substrate-binding domain-containing protein [Oscillibacter sp.]|nr:substrate-binding domain-containing protein [Oscillibacter sp.]